MRTWSLLLMLVFAGCLGSPTDDATIEPGPVRLDSEESGARAGTGSSEELGARAADTVVPHVTDYYRMDLTATPEGSIKAYVVDVPAGATVPHWAPSADPTPVVEFRFDAMPESWGVVFIDLEAGAAITVASGIKADANFGAGSGSPAGQRDIGSGTGDYVELDGMRDGGRLGIAVAAQGEGDLSLHLRFMEKHPFDGEFSPPSRDVAELVERSSKIGWAPLDVAEASGFGIDMFYDYESLVFPYAARVVHGQMAVEELVPDVAGYQPANSLLATAQRPAGAGFTSSLVWSWTGLHAGIAQYTLEARDADPVDATVPLRPDPMVSSVIAASVGDGTGPSQATLALDYAGVYGLFPKLTIVDHFTFDVTLESLFGVVIEDGSYDRGLLATDDPEHWTDRLVFEGPTDRTIRFY